MKERKEGDSNMDEARCYLSMRVNKSEWAALAAKVDKRWSCLQVFGQTQSWGASGQKSDRKEVHLWDCLDRPFLIGFGVDGVEWVEAASDMDFILKQLGSSQENQVQLPGQPGLPQVSGVTPVLLQWSLCQLQALSSGYFPTVRSAVCVGNSQEPVVGSIGCIAGARNCFKGWDLTPPSDFPNRLQSESDRVTWEKLLHASLT